MRIDKHCIGAIIGLAIMLAASPSLHANEPSPVGLWKTIDDSSGQPKGLVRIREANGRFEGQDRKDLSQARAKIRRPSAISAMARGKTSRSSA